MAMCPRCRGKGNKTRFSDELCPECKGSGKAPDRDIATDAERKEHSMDKYAIARVKSMTDRLEWLYCIIGTSVTISEGTRAVFIGNVRMALVFLMGVEEGRKK